VTFFRLILAGLVQHRRLNVAVALGVAAATAVLTGALVVGDSMRGSLRAMVLERLGRIDQVLVVDRFFREELTQEFAREAKLAEQGAEALAALYLTGSIEHAESERRASGVNVLGVDERFWRFGDTASREGIRASVIPGDDEVVINRALADELGIEDVPTGDDAENFDRPEVLLRLPRQQNVPADSPLGRKTDTVDSVRLTVVEIVPNEGLGQFDLQSSQQVPRNAYVSTGTLQSALGRSGQANAIFVAAKSRESHVEFDAAALRDVLKLDADLGLTLKRVEHQHDGKTVHEYFDLTSDRMMIPPAVEEAAVAAWKPQVQLRFREKFRPSAQQPSRVQPVLAYLANWISAGSAGGGEKVARIPYSVVAAVDSVAPLGPLTTDVNGDPIGALAADEIVINSWTYEDLKAQGVDVRPGDTIALDYFEPESTHGEVRERQATFKLRTVAPLAKPDQPPLATNDPQLTPSVPGVTDKESIRNWDAPFPYYPDRVRASGGRGAKGNEDDDYWHDYSTTPKAFVSLAAGRKLWSSRFGHVTSIRVPTRDADGKEITLDALRDRLRSQLDPESVGFAFRAVKKQGLAAAEGTTPFAVLFLSFSMFLIAAAVMLIVLLFRLGVERRASEIGVLLAVGWSARRVRTLLLAEGVVVAAVGALLGTAAGVGFAALMIAGLTTIWVEAIAAPFLELHYTVASLAIGYASGVLLSALAVALSLRKIRKLPVRGLLAGRVELERPPQGRRRWAKIAAGVMLVLAVALAAAAMGLSGEAQAGAFFGSGSLVLGAVLTYIWQRLNADTTRSLVTSGAAAVTRLAVRNTARSPGRSTLTIGLVAAASFLIVAVSAFRLDPSLDGAGGFSLYAESDLPIYHSPGTKAGRNELAFTPEQDELLAKTTTVALRVQRGDDASCLNLYQSQRPRVLGVPPALVERGGFLWAGWLAETDEEKANPWLLLDDDSADVNADVSDTVPIVLDANTATYSLKLGLGDVLDVDDGRGGKIACRVVALLKNSIFQGDVLMSERNFLTSFPDTSGYQLLLVDAPDDVADDVSDALESTLGGFGMDVEPSAERLRGFMAVQNTYLSTFQSLGALGLLLGTFGLAAVQLRNVLERRGELALLQAVGFRRRTLAEMVLAENAALLLAGLVTGVVAAVVAVLPHFFSGGAGVPWETLAAMLAAIFVVGLLAGLWAVRATLDTPVLAALRGD
jgi:ABC-type antimicrobial peptide transport system permease subunit